MTSTTTRNFTGIKEADGNERCVCVRVSVCVCVCVCVGWGYWVTRTALHLPHMSWKAWWCASTKGRAYKKSRAGKAKWPPSPFTTPTLNELGRSSRWIPRPRGTFQDSTLSVPGQKKGTVTPLENETRTRKKKKEASKPASPPSIAPLWLVGTEPLWPLPLLAFFVQHTKTLTLPGTSIAPIWSHTRSAAIRRDRECDGDRRVSART